MLSNPPHMSGSHARHRQHRRQNSTPSAFDAVKIAPLPNLQQRRPVSHRRGLSLDVRAHPQLAPAPTPRALRQEYAAIGPAPTPQHVLQEAPHQRTARQPTFRNQADNDPFLLSPQVAAQSVLFPGALPGQGQNLHGLPFAPYSGPSALMEGSVNLSGSAIDPSREFEFFATDSALSTPSFMTFPDSSPAGTGPGWISETETASTHSRRSSRRISNGILDKVAKFEAMLDEGLDGLPRRPSTPTAQADADFFPQTPVQVSIKQESTPLQPPNRFLPGYDESMEETLKPVRSRNINRSSTVFQEFRQQAEAMVHTPPRANTIPMAIAHQGLRTPEFMNMRNISAEFRKIEREFGSIPTSPIDEAPDMFSLLKSDAFSNKPDFAPPSALDMLDAGVSSPVSQTPSRRTSPHRRTESIASITSAASIADINIEETKTDTGVSIDDIAAFIQGPDPSDGKWRCLYEGCNKPFGRKENIKSHVQTHLNDRQYQCPTCHKCFVRQHDLKRHAKIHTGIKPYPCECGNSFARHDALTRHRQRGMCIGAFDGVVRKVVKRGRPKKIRPDMDERRDKAERTRRKNKLTSADSASSQSGYSDISAAPSPAGDLDALLDDDNFFLASPLLAPQQTATIHPPTLAVSTIPTPPPTTTTTTLSTIYRSISPSAISIHSNTGHAPQKQPTPTPPEITTNPPPSPTKSISSHYNTPPDFSSPRSPPPLLTAHNTPQYFEPTTSQTTNTTTNASSENTSSIDDLSSLSDAAAHGYDGMLLGYPSGADGEGYVGLEGMGLGMGMGHYGGLGGGMMKFEKGFDVGVGEDLGGNGMEGFDGVSMFGNGGDVFFGTA